MKVDKNFVIETSENSSKKELLEGSEKDVVSEISIPLE